MNWKEAADYCFFTYGVFVDYEEGFFICPECEEPIYECDWENTDLSECPICEYKF